MIFLTVGSQMPFDRLVQAVDAWAGMHPDVPVVAQVGRGAAATQHVRRHEVLDPTAFRRCVQEAALLVAHAGMGSVLTGLELGKPMLLLPRLGALRETRNDHQVATLKWLRDKPGVHAAFDVAALQAALDHWQELAMTAGAAAAPSPAQHRLVATLRGFIDAD
ncbi:glycosyltransferase [Paucibacter soli]|uniref:glycosyltransferase n=1 Tax=Paucibacter soli TaxID=3133433 RepID=UPI0030ADB19A